MGPWASYFRALLVYLSFLLICIFLLQVCSSCSCVSTFVESSAERNSGPLKLVLRVGTPDTGASPASDAHEVERKHKHKKKKKKKSSDKDKERHHSEKKVTPNFKKSVRSV